MTTMITIWIKDDYEEDDDDDFDFKVGMAGTLIKPGLDFPLTWLLAGGLNFYYQYHDHGKGSHRVEKVTFL